MRRIKVNMSPSRGYIFRESDGTLIRGGSWKGCIRRVRDYRLRLGKSDAGVEEEVMAQACLTYPDLCYDDSGSKKITHVTKDPRSALKVRMLQWLSDWRKKVEANEKPKFVSDGEAAARGDVCAKCPRHGSLPTGCGACEKATSRLRETVVGTHLPLDHRLQACDVLGYDLKAATHMDLVRLNNGDLPDGCWMKAKA